MQTTGAVIGYCRVSTQRQADHGVSLDAQRESVAAYCKAKDLGEPEFVVDDASGKNLKRPGIQEVIRRSQAGEVRAVVVYALDRLSRRTRDILLLVDEVFDGRVVFASVREDINTAGPMGQFVLTMIGALAQLERGLIGERVREAYGECRRTGRHMGQLPYGYKVGADGKTLERDETTWPTVERIQREREEGRSYSRIAEGLNADGIATLRGGKWFTETVRSLATRGINGTET